MVTRTYHVCVRTDLQIHMEKRHGQQAAAYGQSAYATQTAYAMSSGDTMHGRPGNANGGFASDVAW
jgi:hypothetical protein